jgi:uncharacterized DUF497 family protein
MRYYTWDPAKPVANYRKHRVRFEAAVAVFVDLHVVTEMDRIEGGEQRWRSIGMVDGTLLLLVAHTEEEDDGDEIVRIISARRADRKERRDYETALGSGHRR